MARSLAERAPSGFDLVFAGRPELDLSDDRSIERVITKVAPDLVVSAAAYTAVDRAEDEAALAQAVNVDGPAALARAAAASGARLVHLSTDYVFSGDADHPYTERDQVGPIGVYGKTKLAGEEAIRASGAPSVIMRTAWVYSPFGSNFVKTMLRLAGDREQVNVVDDQHGCPTSALDIADAVFAVAANWMPGTYHFAGTGETNWADFARAIFRESAARGGPAAAVKGIASADYPTRATRPPNSRLNSNLFAETFGYRSPLWRDSLAPVVARLT